MYIGTINDSNSWLPAATAAGLSFPTFQQHFYLLDPRACDPSTTPSHVHLGKDLDEIVYRTLDPEERQEGHEQLLDSLALGSVLPQARTWDGH